MSSFFSQSDNVPQPAPTSLSTREQFAPATGATPSPQPTNTPQVGKGQGAGQAPQYTNLKDFLSGQAAGQVDSEVNPLTDKASKLAGDTQTAANKASTATTASTAAGVNAGGVFSNPATSGTPSSAGTPTTGVAKLASTFGNKIGFGGPTLDSPTSGTFTPTAAASGPTASATSGDPSYDFSKVNLAGYQGPSTSDVQGAFGGAQSASALAQANASQLASGTPTYNAFDNAAITTNPGAWGKLQASLTGENQAVANAGAQQAGAVQGVAQAQQASGNSVAKQKSDLGAISGSAASTAAATTARLSSAVTAFTDPTPTNVASALTSNPNALVSVGLNASTAINLGTQLANGTLSMAEVQAALKPYIDAAKASSGYTGTSAANTNTAGRLLGTGQTVSSATTATAAAPSPVTTHVTTQGRQNDIAKIKGDSGTLGENGGSPQLHAAIADLASAGYSLNEIAQLAGLDPKLITPAYNEAVNTTDSVTSKVPDSGVTYQPVRK